MTEFPCITDMINILKQLSFRSNSDEAKAKSKLLNRLKDLRRSLACLDVQCSRDVFRLLNGRSVILDVSEVNDIALPFLFAFMTKLFGAVFHSDDPKIRRMKVIEEAHTLLGGHIDKRTSDIKEGTASGILRDLRKSECCGLVVTHLPQDLEDAVLGNLGTVFCMRLGDGRSVNRAALCVNLEPWQRPEIAQLPDRHAIARFSRYGKPVQLVIKDAARILSGTRRVSRDEACEWSRLVLEKFPYIKRAPEKVEDAQDEEEKTFKAAGGLPRDARRAYARIAELPWEIVVDRMDALGLDRSSENDARDQLENLGLIRFSGKAGAKKVLYELTERGREVAERMGLKIASPGKGGVPHQSIAFYAEKSLKRYRPDCRFERVGVSSTLGGVQPDSLLILPDGGRVPIQACCNNQPSYEAEAILKLHEFALLGACPSN